eukprot:CAMPEP_0172841790 /NCGR_PEP_ID=MMETSP1075-20121228/30250_1 /TAXON_ID=2916 /ORGANISM="Ceratium fusus, Strain PA161109" /LENGTH=146 /DNA_ID=CAMNT_0013685821 /DNA_START=668 /DNA_END=1108 /DNA_ORIENTATION=-
MGNGGPSLECMFCKHGNGVHDPVCTLRTICNAVGNRSSWFPAPSSGTSHWDNDHPEARSPILVYPLEWALGVLRRSAHSRSQARPSRIGTLRTEWHRAFVKQDQFRQAFATVQAEASEHNGKNYIWPKGKGWCTPQRVQGTISDVL